MLSVLRGVLPSSPLVWAGPSAAVTGETGGGVASPQKSGELNKPPLQHTRILFHSVCAHGQLQKKFLHCTEKEEEVVTQSCPGSVQIFLSSSLTRLFFSYSSSISLLSLAHLLYSRRPASANVFTLCFTAHLSALKAARPLFLSVRPCLCSRSLSESSHLLLGAAYWHLRLPPLHSNIT